MSAICELCRRPLGARVYVYQGLTGVYEECEWCHTNTRRPVEPELITDTFRPPPLSEPARTLDQILDAMLVPEQS